MAMLAIGDTLRHHAMTRPAGEIALVYPDIALTREQMERGSSQWARKLKSLGVGKDDFVAVALPNAPVFHLIAFAIWKLGATPAVVSARLPQSEFLAILDLLKPKLVVTATGTEVQGFAVLSADADVSAFDDGPMASEVATHWKAMTSGGSTGRPKIIVDHIRAEVELVNPGGFSTDTVVLNPGPLYHNAPFQYSSRCLVMGGKLVGMTRFDAEEALRLIEAHRVTWVNMVPTMMHRIWSLPRAVRERYDLSSLRSLFHMAAPCPPWLKEAWIDWLGGDRVFELYGGTEGTGATLITGTEWLAKRGSVGKAAGGTRVKALRDDGSDCAPGEIGELYFQPANPVARTSHYIGAESRRRADGWELFGDLGHIDEEGYVFLADRRTDLILRGGANIYPAEIEAALDAHPNVASSIVVGLPDPEMGQRVHAIVQIAPDAPLDIHEMNAFLAARLVKYKLPEFYEIVDSPLRDDAGKARRSALRDERIAWLDRGIEFRLPAFLEAALKKAARAPS